MKELPRYSSLDSYTHEELRRKYQASDSKARIDLLQNFYNKNDTAPPFEIALLAVEDSNVEVRQWIARHGKYLDYREMRMVEKSLVYEESERNLEDRLKNDPDPFVRACLHENPDVFGGIGSFGEKWIEYFAGATHLERLALVRNPECGSHGKDLIEKIFDPEDQELGINLEERKELVLAFLTNKEALDLGEVKAQTSLDAWGAAIDKQFFNKLWELAPKWPNETWIQASIYRFVPADDETKAEHYKKYDEAAWRGEILENCQPKDTKTINLGMDDTNDLRRFVAYSKVRHLEPDKLEAILQREEVVNLSALASNESLPVEQLEKVRERLVELTKDKLGDDLWLIEANKTIRKVRRRQATDDPEDSFDEDYEEDGGRSVGQKSIISWRPILLVLGGFIGLFVGHNFLGFWTEEAYDRIGLILLVVFFAWLVERWIDENFVATHRRLDSIEKKIGRLKVKER